MACVRKGRKELYTGILRPPPLVGAQTLVNTKVRALYTREGVDDQRRMQMNVCTCTHTFAGTHRCAQLNSLTSVNWQVINLMMQNQNTRGEDGEVKNNTGCNCVCPDPAKKHLPSPLRNPCLCIFGVFLLLLFPKH